MSASIITSVFIFTLICIHEVECKINMRTNAQLYVCLFNRMHNSNQRCISVDVQLFAKCKLTDCMQRNGHSEFHSHSRYISVQSFTSPIYIIAFLYFSKNNFQKNHAKKAMCATKTNKYKKIHGDICCHIHLNGMFFFSLFFLPLYFV